MGVVETEAMTEAPPAGELPSYQVFPLRTRRGFMTNYCYLVLDRGSKEAAVVDPAWELELLQGKLQELGGRLTTVLLTHSHYDHVNLVPALVREYDPVVVLSRREEASFPFSCGRVVPAEHLDRIQLGETAITCLLTPGHTVGSMCFLLAQSLFTGDTVFVEGCGLCLSEAGASRMFESIQLIKRLVQPHVCVFPGHSYGRAPGCSFEALMEQNIYFHIEKQRQFIAFRMRKGQSGLFAFK